MKQAIVYGARDLRLEEKPLDPDSLSEGQVYVETEVTALSTGTELGAYVGKSTEVPGAPGYPRTVGYCNVGVVKRAASGVSKFAIGDRVFSLRPHQSAFIARETDLLVRVPTNVSSEQASLAYLANLGLAGLRQARYEPGENVAVVGVGIIGLCTIALARAVGASVLAVSNSPERAELAKRLGARDTLDSAPDIVVLTANSWDAYRASLELVRNGGRVSILGFPGRGLPAPDFNPVAAEWIYAKQLTLIGAGRCSRVECDESDIRFNLRRNLEFILGLMSHGVLDLSAAITHRLPATRMQEAYELAAAHSKALAGVVFRWS